MASIPLPALDVRPPTDPLTEYAKVMGIKSMMQQQQQNTQLMPGQLQQQQQQITATGQENQQRDIQLRDQQAQTKALQEWDGKDVDQLPGLLLKHGGSATAVFGMKNQLVDEKTKLATLDKDTLDNQAKRNDLISGHLEAVKSAPTDQKQAAFDSAVTDLEQKGLVKPGQIAHQYPGDDKIDLIEKSFMGQKAIVDQEMKKREVDAGEWKPDTGTGALVNVRTGEIKTVNGAMSPALADSKYRDLQQAQNLKKPVSAEDKAWMQAYEKQKELVSTNIFERNQGPFATPQAPTAPGETGADALAKMNPAVRAMVKMVGDYKQKSSEITQRLSPSAKANFLSALNSAYPNYDENEFPARNKMVTSFTSGPESKSINAINTAMGHVGVLNDAIDALNNGDIKALNALENKLGLQLDKTPAAALNTIVHRVGPELAAAYIQGGGGEGERGTTAADFDANLGPKTLHNNAAITATLLRSKIGSLEHQWNTTMKPGTPDQQFQSRFITPEAQATLNKLSPQSGGAGQIKITAPDGSVHTFPDQKSADNFKQLAHIQ
jgi:hypothetical protein